MKNITKNWGALGEAIRKVAEAIEFVQKLTEKFGIDKYGEKQNELMKKRREMIIEQVGKTDFWKPQIIQDLLSMFSGGGATQNNNINVNITGTGDPVAVGDAAAKSIQREINAASAQLSRNQ